MTPRYWLLLGAFAVGTTQAVACSSNSDSCADTRTCAASGAGGGHSEAGEGGEPAGGGAGKAGHGDAGAPEGDLGGEGGGAGETGGSAGAAPQAPTLFGACTMLGKTVCEGVAASGRLSCDGSKWQPGAVCPDGQLCDSTSGACTRIVAECATAKPGDSVCRGDVLLKCGPDLVTTDAGTKCDGLCTNGVCQAPSCGDNKKEAGEDCDDAAATASGACVNCKNAACGDGAVYAGHEQCDDGNVIAGDGCSSDCKWEPVAIAAGEVSTCALSKNGVVKCWGDNAHGELGIGQSVSHTVAPGDAVPLGMNRTAKAVAVGNAEACAILDNGDLKCWGSNEFGQLGQNTAGPATDIGDQSSEMGDNLHPISLGQPTTAVSVGGSHTCAVLQDGKLKCWGSNALGQLGQDNGTDYSSPPSAAINVGGRATSVSAGPANTTCALLADGSGKCWGTGAHGSLSVVFGSDKGVADRNVGTYVIGDYIGANAPQGEMAELPALSFGSGFTAKQIGAAFQSSCALLNSNKVKCWGSNAYGELGPTPQPQAGNGPAELAALSPIDLGPGTVKSIAVGAWHICAILDDGSVKCWGAGSLGRLGIGTTDNRGDGPNEMGTNLPPVQLGGHKAVQLTAAEHTCALLDNGTVMCWGYNTQGQLGIGSTENALTPKLVNLTF